MGQAIVAAQKHRTYDRFIVITDMQFADSSMGVVPKGAKGYTINTAAYNRPGLLQGNWTHLSGFSTAVLRWIAEDENRD